MITKSDYVNYCKCPNLYYFNKFRSDLKKPLGWLEESIIESGNEIGEYARGYFGDYFLINRENKSLNDTYKETLDAINSGNKVICEASFIFNDLYCAVDILKINDDKTVDIYEVKASKDITESYLNDVSFQYYVLTSLGYKVNNAYIMHPDKNYRFKDKLDIKGYFDIYPVTIKDDVDSNLDEIRKISSSKVLDANSNCKKCEFLRHCHEELEDNNIFDTAGNINQAQLYNAGIKTFKDLLDRKSSLWNKKKKICNINKALQQVDFELNNLPMYVDKVKVKDYLDKLQYPLYYLDFESVKDVFPFINGTPIQYERVMQYSLHIQREPNGPLEHKEYLQESLYDNIEEVVDRLIEDLETKGDIIVYNHFERDRFNSFIELVPSKAKELTAIKERLNDAMKIFQNREVYCKEMHGSYSIKQVLPALCPEHKDDYNNLPYVHNGGNIDFVYKELIDPKNEKHDFIKDAMLKYCGQDTLSEVYIIEKLYELVK